MPEVPLTRFAYFHPNNTCCIFSWWLGFSLLVKCWSEVITRLLLWSLPQEIWGVPQFSLHIFGVNRSQKRTASCSVPLFSSSFPPNFNLLPCKLAVTQMHAGTHWVFMDLHPHPLAPNTQTESKRGTLGGWHTLLHLWNAQKKTSQLNITWFTSAVFTQATVYTFSLTKFACKNKAMSCSLNPHNETALIWDVLR